LCNQGLPNTLSPASRDFEARKALTKGRLAGRGLVLLSANFERWETNNERQNSNGKLTSYTCSVSGREEGRITGLVAAEVAEHLYSSTNSPGVFHIEQLFEQPREFIEGFSKRVTDMEYRF
jgi:hypothetical protein